MATVRRILDLDPQTDARLVSIAAEKGQDAATVVSDAIALLVSVVDIEVSTSKRTGAVSLNSSAPARPCHSTT